MRTKRYFIGKLWVINKEGLNPKQRRYRYQRLIDGAYALNCRRAPAPSKWHGYFTIPDGARFVSEYVEFPPNPVVLGSRSEHVFAAFKAKAELAAAQGRFSVKLRALSGKDIIELQARLDGFPPIAKESDGHVVTWFPPKELRFDGRSRKIRDQKEVI